MKRHLPKTSFALLAAALLSACATGAGTQSTAPDYRAVVASADRSDSDRDTDKRRKPEQLLAFVGARPGMKVLDMGAGSGYSTELLARAVAPGGTVVAQNPQPMSPRGKERFDERMKTPAMKNVALALRGYEDPVPPEARNLDLITFFFAYHDVSFMNVDRAKMNRALFDALRPGGMLVLADHSAKAGEGVSMARTLHRIEQSLLRREIEAAGFKLTAEGDFLRHPDDPRDTPVSRSPVPVDEFVLKFVKP